MLVFKGNGCCTRGKMKGQETMHLWMTSLTSAVKFQWHENGIVGHMVTGKAGLIDIYTRMKAILINSFLLTGTCKIQNNNTK